MMTLLTAIVLACVPAVLDERPATAAAALERAARFQRGDVPVRAADGFHGRFYVTVRKRGGGTVNADIERTYSRSPERIVTTRVDSVVNTNSTVGFDGRRAWFRDNDGGRVIVYNDDPEAFDVDLEEIERQLDLTRLILDAAVLDVLVPRLEDVTHLGREEERVGGGDRRTVERVSALVVDEVFGAAPDGPPPGPDDPLPRLRVVFSIDVETGALWSLEVGTVGRVPPRRLVLRFAWHAPTRSGLRVPANIKVFEDGAPKWSANLGLVPDESGERDPATGEEYVVFELNPPLDPEIFAPPSGDDD